MISNPPPVPLARRVWSRRAGAVLTTLAFLGVTGVAGAGSANAADTRCWINAPEVACTTGTLWARASDHSIYLYANVQGGNGLVCRAHDADNGIMVGRVDGPGGFLRIYGLYNRYFAVCVNSRKIGGGKLSH
jgi:hypothetical protein